MTTYYKTKIILSATILIAVFSFLYFFTGVFGETQIALTITTNPDLKRGLIGHWTFDGINMDTASNTAEVLDSSGNGNNGDWLNHASTTVPGSLGQAIDFDGTDDYIDAGDVGSGVKTVAVWIRRDTLGADGLINIDGTDQIEINASNEVVATSFPAATVYIDGSTATSAITDFNWHHVTIVDTTGVTASTFEVGLAAGGSTDTGFKFPGSTDGSRGKTASPNWVNHANITADDGSDAVVTLGIFDNSDGLGASNFDFSSVPSGATIDGIEVRVGDYLRTNFEAIWYFSNLILADNTDGSENKQAELVDPTGTANTDEAGGASDLWGETLTDTDVKDVDFGFFVRVIGSIEGDVVNVDFMQMKVYYTSSDYFDGKMDDVRVYNRVLSAEEISRLYQLGATTKIAKTITTNPDLKNGLVGHWTFDGINMDTASNTAEVLDSSGNSNNGDWLNHGTTTKPGKIGQAIDFDGTDDYIDAGDVGSGVQTIAAWIKRDTTGADALINIDGTDQVKINANNEVVATSFPAATVYIDGSTATSAIADLEWHHVTIVDTTGVSASTLEIGQIPSGGSPTDTGFLFPGTAVGNRTVSGGDKDWSNPDEIKADDGRDTDVFISSQGDESNGLAATNFDFSAIPAGVTIDGVETQIGDYFIDGGLWGRKNIRLILADNTDGSENKVAEWTNWTGVAQTDEQGGASDLWSETITRADVQDADWGFFISANLAVDASPPHSAFVDFMKMKVYYSSTSYFDGKMDDVRVYNRVLSDAEITRLYELGATTKIATTITTNPDLENGLVGHWTFDGKDIDTVSNQITDRSTGSNNGSTVGMDTATTTRPGRIGQSLEFDGVDDYLTIGSVGSTKTWAFWVNTSTTTISQNMLEFNNGADRIETDTSSVVTATSFPAATVYVNGTTSPLGLSQGWHHVAVTDTTGITVNSLNTGTSTVYFGGKMDDIRLYDRVLSDAEITRLYGLGN